MLSFAIAIGIGGAAGSLLRWWMGVLLNPVWSTVPLGTVFVNLVGCFFIGLTSTYFSTHGTLAPEWRLGIVTGVIGGFTTFSTFTFELVTMLQEGRMFACLSAVGIHLGGGLILAACGVSLGIWLWAE